jgi:hypothetical protein
MRLRRVENGFHFTSCEAGYFTMRDSALFHIRRKANISLSSNGYNKKGRLLRRGNSLLFYMG